MREIRGKKPSDREDDAGRGASPAGAALDPQRSAHELFAYWRVVLMGNLGSRRALPAELGGWFFSVGDGTEIAVGPAGTNRVPVGGDYADLRPRPLALVRRELLRLLDRVDLSDQERTVIELYFGLHGLPLPYSAAEDAPGPDIAGGRHESSPRGSANSALTKISAHVERRPLPVAPPRPVIDPVLEPWFLGRVLQPASRRRVVARAWVRAMAQCDGPHSPPTRAALEHWFRTCGYHSDHLLPATSPRTSNDPAGGHQEPARGSGRRPNRNALARAAALMELALFQEVANRQLHLVPASREVPTPRHRTPRPTRLTETVSHPDLVGLLDDDLAPDQLVRAARTVQNLTLDGNDVTGQIGLLLRCLRPRVGLLVGLDLEHVAVAISYVAATTANPHLGLEWLGVFLDRVGVTDRTFTVLVNVIEAAAAAGNPLLAERAERLFHQLRTGWEIPDHQIPRVEWAECEQQRLVAAAHRFHWLARAQAAAGDRRGAIDIHRRSIDAARRSVDLALILLTDTRTYPRLELEGKAGDHGGDLTWPWLLGSVATMVEPLPELSAIDDGGTEVIAYGTEVATFARRMLGLYPEVADTPRFRNWYERIEAVTAELAD